MSLKDKCAFVGVGYTPQGKLPDWVKTSGKGKLLTWTVVHKAFILSFAEEVPYIVAVATLDEGVRVTARGGLANYLIIA